MSKESKISILLLMIPLIVSSLLFLPIHEEFTTKGDIEPITEFGIDGSVYFTYVHSGIIENYLEKFFLDLQHDDIEYLTLNDYEYDYYTTEYENDVQYYKEQTIVNAVNLTSEHEPKAENQDRISDIMYEAREYYGDSFGLMVAVGLLEEELSKDYSRGESLLISGTGTIEKDQSVGSVGAIRYKLLTAEENGVDIFFVPKDEAYYGEASNQRKAINVLRQEDLELEVVYVSTLQEAINFLENLN
ncbi:hypothetical protein CEY16_00120 [Halalkalibacillus sediminis]|uniref:Lon proteolytic domain-containing protein n=1 Tax=Halalkalibacillus sediminis TaxID=2018042 RepID=A0A2I0QV23_9BACI|nr:hypothetical protein [Halalkalibacillus sediminis]PKR78202.1 hypothetical protein CEY16_00120 [Halalkalibacillus sediminis]